MFPHARAAVEALINDHSGNPDILACILIGSQARGDAREGSDIDFNLVMSDGKTDPENTSHVSKRDLIQIRDHGNELTRWAYTNAKLLFCWDQELVAIVQAIPVYPEADRIRKMESFVSQIHMHLSYLKLAEYSSNCYLLHETTVKIALFCGRLILADNRILYPNRKWFKRELLAAPDQPKGFSADLEAMLQTPSIAAAEALINKLLNHKKYPEAPEGWFNRFHKDSVLHWCNGTFSIDDW